MRRWLTFECVDSGQSLGPSSLIDIECIRKYTCNANANHDAIAQEFISFEACPLEAQVKFAVTTKYNKFIRLSFDNKYTSVVSIK